MSKRNFSIHVLRGCAYLCASFAFVFVCCLSYFEMVYYFCSVSRLHIFALSNINKHENHSGSVDVYYKTV